MKKLYSLFVTVLTIVFLSIPVIASETAELWDIDELKEDPDRQLSMLGDYFLFFPSTWEIKKNKPDQKRGTEFFYPPDTNDQDGNTQVYFMKTYTISSAVEETPEALSAYYDKYMEDFGKADGITVGEQEDVELLDTTCRLADFTMNSNLGLFICKVFLYKEDAFDYSFCIMQREDCAVDYMPVYDHILNTADMSEISAQFNAESEFRVDAGTYEVGKDIDAGEYILFATSSSGYFSVCADSNGADIIFNDNFDYNSIITVYGGDFLKMNDCWAFPIEKNIREVNTSEHGMFKVGVHIPPGTYNLVVDNGSDEGYYCIYSSSRQDNIVSNEIFENNSIVTVSDGQYLKLSQAVFENPPGAPAKSYSDETTVKAVQEKLNENGYDCGIADGISGDNTKAQISQYQSDHGLETTGIIDDALLENLGLS